MATAVQATKVQIVTNGQNQMAMKGGLATKRANGFVPAKGTANGSTTAFLRADNSWATAVVVFTKAGAPNTTDIPAGTAAIVRDTVGATTKLYYNNAGSLQSVALV